MRQAFAAMFAAVGSIAYGYSASIIAYTIGYESFFEYMKVVKGTSKGDTFVGAANGLFGAGGFFGCVFVSWAAQALGRKISMQIGCCICILGSFLMTFAVNQAMFLCSRFITGISIGILVTLVPLYQSEISAAKSRGRMVGFHGILIGISYAMAGFISYATTFSSNKEFQWRFPLAIQILPVVILFVGLFFLPYSPRWLLSKGREEEARSTVHKLNTNYEKAEEEYIIMREQILEEKAKGLITTWGQGKLAFSRSSFRKRLFIGFMLQVGNQAAGSLVVNNYQTIIYNSLGIEGSLSILLVACWCSVSIFGNLVTCLLVDKVGRRPFLLVGISGCVVCLSILAAISHQFIDINPSNDTGKRAGVGIIFVYIVFYSGGLDVCQYLVAAEIAPMQIRSFSMAVASSGQWLSSVLFLGVGPTALTTIGWKFYLVFICGGLTYFICVFFFVPETKGLTLEEIAGLFGDEDVIGVVPHISSNKNEKNNGQSSVSPV